MISGSIASDNKLIVVDYKATAKNGEITLDHTLPE